MQVTNLGMSDAIAQQLRSDILRGVLAGGERLRQDHIAERFGASHVPVREALQKLGAEGLVIFQPRRGAMVTPLSLSDAQEITEMRLALECLALKNTLEFFGEEDILAAEQAIEFGDLSEDLDQLMTSNWNFHRALCGPQLQPRLMKTIDELWLHNERYQRLVFETVPYKKKSQQEHSDILSRIKDGDGEGAVDLLASHIREGGAVMAEILRSSLS